jgi:hypothetical protein
MQRSAISLAQGGGQRPAALILTATACLRLGSHLLLAKAGN